MATTKLIISGPEGTRDIGLETEGVTLGRGTNCDVRLEHESVSRLHARLFCDPFGRWIIEDLQSHNGVFVRGERIKVLAISPGETIDIPPFSLSLSEERDEQIAPDSSVRSSGMVVDGMNEEVVSYEVKPQAILPSALIRYLNEVTGRLLGLPGPADLYSEACRYLAEMLDALVAFVRLPPGDEPLPTCPEVEVLACRFGRDEADEVIGQTSNMCFSRRVLNAVRSCSAPVMARSRSLADQQMMLTIVDETRPHVVYAARVSDSDSTGAVEALYVDILEDKSPKEAFEFVEAVARQINFARKSLLLSEAKAERRILDQQLSLAHDIQSRLTPEKLEGKFAVDVAVCYEPAMWVGGDYYDIWSPEEGRIAFAVGDVSGKGLPAALIMSNLQAALRTTMTFCSELSAVAEYVNRHLCENLRDDMFVTLFLGLFDPAENKLAYVNAGHLQPLLKRPLEPAMPLEEGGNLPLGILDGPYEMAEVTIDPDACLVTVTDGITEAGSPDGAMYEMERLVQLVTNSEARSAEEIIQSVTKSVTDFRRTLAQQDDITVFALVNHTADSENVAQN